jgi:hypothetical protein
MEHIIFCMPVSISYDHLRAGIEFGGFSITEPLKERLAPRKPQSCEMAVKFTLGEEGRGTRPLEFHNILLRKKQMNMISECFCTCLKVKSSTRSMKNIRSLQLHVIVYHE